ncbi:nitroreductase [Litorimonas sp. RW-G-Af-16]|uniref:nitroreductase family protein n=1 Tax=Litorimonas sp. RW-G-Af-16 TaxID=3241168 RepID=UPI00390CAC40
MSDQPKVFDLPQSRPETLDFLRERRSNLAKVMEGDGAGPSADQITELLTIGARVPDHRKLAPWRFLTFQGKARADIGQHIATSFMKANPTAPQDRAIFEGQRFLRAPLVIGVISSPVDCPRGTPKWEQVLSAGAVCFNLCLAAQAMGFGAQWLTEWYAYDSDVQAALGLSEVEEVAGFIYIGPVTDAPSERARPDIHALTKAWTG